MVKEKKKILTCCDTNYFGIVGPINQVEGFSVWEFIQSDFSSVLIYRYPVMLIFSCGISEKEVKGKP